LFFFFVVVPLSSSAIHTERINKQASKQATAANHPHHTPHSSATPTYLGFSQIPHKTPQIPQQIPHTPEKASALYTGLLQLTEDLNCKKLQKKLEGKNKWVEEICI
jgi:hypothetical protein